MRYAAALVLLVFAAGVAVAADDPAAECLDAVQREDFDAAVTPCTKAAEQGHATAQRNLGVMYFWGYGVPEDKAKAVKWYTKAGEQGDDSAQFQLGLMYLAGEGVPKNGKKAVEWLTKAAELGYHKAQYKLGTMYAAGTGVPEDHVRAYKWVVLASVCTPDAKALFPVKRAKRLRKRLQRNMTEEQLAEAQRLSTEWFEKFKAKQDGD